jgi:hypothetical protein
MLNISEESMLNNLKLISLSQDSCIYTSSKFYLPLNRNHFLITQGKRSVRPVSYETTNSYALCAQTCSEGHFFVHMLHPETTE